MKKLLSLALALAMLLALAACSSSSSSDDDASEETAEETAETEESSDEEEEETEEEEEEDSSSDGTVEITSTETYTLTLSCHDADTSVTGIYLQAWADEVYEVTNGGVTINCVWSGTLASAADVGDMVKSQGVDIGWIYIGYYSGQYPLSEVLSVPMQGFGDPVVSTEVLWALAEGDYPDVIDEWSEDYKVLMLYGNPGMMLYSNVEINSLDDLAGVSIRCPAGVITDVLAAWGASPITMATADIYQAVEKNNIAGYIFEPSGVKTWSLDEVTSYCYDYVMYDGAFCVGMNWDQWNSLPEDYQAAIESVSGYDASIAAAQAFADDVSEAREEQVEAGMEFLDLDEDMLAEMQEIADEYAADWADSLEDVDGAAFLEAAKELAAQYSE